MARNVEDVALLLDAMSGEQPADPLSLPLLPVSFLSAARSGKGPKRVAYSPDLGITPVDPEVAAITRKAAARFAEAGAIVEEAHPDLREAHECFHVLRAFDFAISKAALLRDKRDHAQARSDLEYRGRPQAHGRAAGARGSATRRDDRAHARVFQDLRPAADARRPSSRRFRSRIATSPNAPARNSTIMSSGSASSMRSRWYAARRCRCRAVSPRQACRSVCRWWRRRAARRSCSPAPGCLRIFWASAAPRRSIRGRRSSSSITRVLHRLESMNHARP